MKRIMAIAFLVLASGSIRAGETVVLFDGKGFDAWDFVLQDPNAKMEDVWSIDGDAFTCKGRPVGYLRTKQSFENYVLTLEWRFPKGSKGGNSGVLLHTSKPGEIGIWPKSIEAQLQSGSAGDFWVIGETIQIDHPEGRIEGRRHKRTAQNIEKPFGEWNTYEITCKGDEIIVKINGTVVNHAKKCSTTKGAICLQSEGAEIQFRNVKLTKLD